MRSIKDPIRFAARRLIPDATYEAISRLINAVWVIVVEGWPAYKLLMRPRQPGESVYREVPLRKLDYPITIRPGTPDVACIVQNLVRAEYGQFSLPLGPSLIIDAGAYIGDVSIYFMNRFPDASIIALEPSHEHYALAMINLAPYAGRFRLLNKALWYRRTTMSLAGDYIGGALQEYEPGSRSVDCVELDSLLSDLNVERVDILKLDIEGAEDEVLMRNNDSWLRKTDRLIVEFHSPDVASRCTSMLVSKGFKTFRYRSLHYFYRHQGGS